MTANNTLNRPRMDLGGPHPHYTPNTSPMGAGGPGGMPPAPQHNHHGNNLAYADDRLRVSVVICHSESSLLLTHPAGMAQAMFVHDETCTTDNQAHQAIIHLIQVVRQLDDKSEGSVLFGPLARCNEMTRPPKSGGTG